MTPPEAKKFLEMFSRVAAKQNQIREEIPSASDLLALRGFVPPTGSPILPPPPHGIVFQRTNGPGVPFSEPSRFPLGLNPPPNAGIYAILVRDPDWGPRNFRPIYFGKAVNANARVTQGHERYDDWCAAAGGAHNLYVAYHWCDSEETRTTIETGLIRHYTPCCNEQHKKPDLLAHV